MNNDFDEHLKAIVSHHLSRILDYNPLYNFPNVKTNKEFIQIIKNDPAFSPFNLDREKYVVARFGGNLITSLHRKIGDIYEDLTKEILSKKLGIPLASLEHSLTLKINDEIQKRSTDGRILIDEIKDAQLKENSKKIIEAGVHGIALEVRSCYQIGDSKRIQADRDMALALRDISLEPVMLIYCATSLKSPIIRLKSYWNLKEGMDAFNYLKNLTGYDMFDFLTKNGSLIKPIMDKVFNIF